MTKKIWFVTNFSFPIIPPQFGGTVRTYHIAKSLADSSHDVNLLSFSNEKNRVTLEENMREWHIRGTFWSNRSLLNRIVNYVGFVLTGQPTNFWIINSNLWIESLLRKSKCDLIVCEQIWIAPLAIKIAKSLGIPLILNSHNFYTEIYYRYLHDLGKNLGLASTLKYLAYKLLKFEKRVINEADLVLCVSNRDLQRYQTLGVPYHRLMLVPNGVNLAQFRMPLKDSSIIRNQLGIPLGKPVVVFLGAQNYWPNSDAVKHIVTQIAPSMKDVYFLILGQGWHPKKRENIVFTGSVSSIPDFLNIADISIAPLSVGGGTKLKILEYIAAGKPIIGTPIAFEGLNLTSDDVIIEEDISEFPNQIARLINSPELSQELVYRTQQIIEQYTWNQVTLDLTKWIQRH